MSNSATGSHILAAVDGSAASDAAVRWAAHEAAMRRLPLKLLHAVQPTPFRSAEGPTDDAITQSQIDHARRIVDASRALVDQLILGTPLDVHIEVQYARIAPALAGASRQAWMIVVGNRGLDAVEEHVLGSVSAGLLNHAQCPVAVVHEPGSAQQHIGDGAPVLAASTGHRRRSRRSRWPSTKRRGVAWRWWRCTHGATSGYSRCWAWTGESIVTKAPRCSQNGWRAGKDNIPTCGSRHGWSVTSRTSGSSKNRTRLNWSSWVTVVTAHHPKSIWAQFGTRLRVPREYPVIVTPPPSTEESRT